MASDSESGHTSQGFSSVPELSEILPLRSTKVMIGEMLSPTAARRTTSVKGGLPRIMKRAVSSPNVRDLANLDTSGMSSAEKKRNKLGYHRTAVACVHCRRRKIRCILATDEPTTRCHNCIRLKKDCQFYPVDQQPLPGKRTRSSSKNEESTNESPTPEVSPAMTGAPWEQSESFIPGQFQTSAVPSENASSFSFHGPTLHSENSGFSSASYSTSNMYSESPWSSTPVLTSPSHTIESDDFDTSSSAHWHPQAQPGPPGQCSIQENFSTFPYTQMSEPHDWSHLPHQPVRSMSLASPHELHNYDSPYQNDPRILLQRDSTIAPDMRLTTSAGNTNPTPPGSDALSTHSAYAYSDHTQMGASYHSMATMQNPSMPHPASEAFIHGYYGAPIGLADVKEEEEMANMHHQTLSGRFRQKPG